MTLGDIRKAKTSELIALLNPETVARAIDEACEAAGIEATHDMLREAIEMVAAEIDRRIPVVLEAP